MTKSRRIETGPTNRLEGDSAAQLLGYILKLEDIANRIEALKVEKRILYGEARACGFGNKVVQDLIVTRSRARKVLPKLDDMTDTYLAAIENLEKEAE